jgi:hypothetical protein
MELEALSPMFATAVQDAFHIKPCSGVDTGNGKPALGQSLFSRSEEGIATHDRRAYIILSVQQAPTSSGLRSEAPGAREGYAIRRAPKPSSARAIA